VDGCPSTSAKKEGDDEDRFVGEFLLDNSVIRHDWVECTRRVHFLWASRHAYGHAREQLDDVDA
jgi:hypothetical protein